MGIRKENQKLIQQLEEFKEDGVLSNEKKIIEIIKQIDDNIRLCRHKTKVYSLEVEVEECELCGMQIVRTEEYEYTQCCDYDYKGFN